MDEDVRKGLREMLRGGLDLLSADEIRLLKDALVKRAPALFEAAPVALADQRQFHRPDLGLPHPYLLPAVGTGWRTEVETYRNELRQATVLRLRVQHQRLGQDLGPEMGGEVLLRHGYSFSGHSDDHRWVREGHSLLTQVTHAAVRQAGLHPFPRPENDASTRYPRVALRDAPGDSPDLQNAIQALLAAGVPLLRASDIPGVLEAEALAHDAVRQISTSTAPKNPL